MADDVATQAREIWNSFDDNEKYGVKLGLFPHNKMPEKYSHDLIVALMKMKDE